jgi:hypothetical protein
MVRETEEKEREFGKEREVERKRYTEQWSTAASLFWRAFVALVPSERAESVKELCVLGVMEYRKS